MTVCAYLAVCSDLVSIVGKYNMMSTKTWIQNYNVWNYTTHTEDLELPGKIVIHGIYKIHLKMAKYLKGKTTIYFTIPHSSESYNFFMRSIFWKS